MTEPMIWNIHGIESILHMFRIFYTKWNKARNMRKWTIEKYKTDEKEAEKQKMMMKKIQTNTCMYKYALLKTVRNDFNISTCEDLGISGIHFQFS